MQEDPALAFSIFERTGFGFYHAFGIFKKHHVKIPSLGKIEAMKAESTSFLICNISAQSGSFQIEINLEFDIMHLHISSKKHSYNLGIKESTSIPHIRAVIVKALAKKVAKDFAVYFYAVRVKKGKNKKFDPLQLKIF
jgi:hypothetical protein